MGSFLATMACGAPSYGRETWFGGHDDWSWTVQELLDQTSALPIVKRVPGVLRGRHHAIGFHVAQADTTRAAASLSAAAAGGAAPFDDDFYDGGGDDRGGEEEVEWPAGPISVVHLRLVHVEAKSGEAAQAG